MQKGKFRKKPIVIEAYRTDKELIINTPEGQLRAAPGDWIITGVRGEQYPCKPDVFEKPMNRLMRLHINWSTINLLFLALCFRLNLCPAMVFICHECLDSFY